MGEKGEPTDRGEGTSSRTLACRIGLIAGAGGLPAEAIRVLGARGIACEVYGFEGITAPNLAPAANRSRLGQLGALVESLQRAEIECLLLIGKFSKSLLFDAADLLEPDAEAIQLLASADGWDDDGLMGLMARWLESRGFELCRQDDILEPILAKPGPLTARPPTASELSDLSIGRTVVEMLGRAGVGQAAALRNGNVLALEAIEGTDEMIRRAGEWGGAGATIVKAARPGQDRRFDLPAIGRGTIEAMQAAGATGLAVEAGATLLVDADSLRHSADAAGIAVWGFEFETAQR